MFKLTDLAAWLRRNRFKQQDAPPLKGHETNAKEDLSQEPGKSCVVIEVDHAEPLVGDLFRRRFNTSRFPQKPRHFVALALLQDSILSLGYVHYTMWNGSALCGGLVVDNRHYRQLQPTIRKALQNYGGIAELLLRESFARLPEDTIAIWGYVGDPQAEKVDLRVGFRRVPGSKYLMVIWKDANLSDEDKKAWIQQMESYGPF